MVSPCSHSLSRDEITRFSRQLMLKGIGPSGQERIRDSKVLIIGAGGLGCPVALYLAAAGVGTICIVDHDTVSIDNLHRQIAHNEQRVGVSKAESLKESMLKINSKVKAVVHQKLLTNKNALQIFCDYYIVADCSDNVATRYLINDACVLTGKPLVSGSALGWEGQLTVYNNGPKCPCYRCIFPDPPRPEMVTSCSEGGVLGPIVGVIGSMQALEVLKIAVLGKSSYAGNLWLFDGFDGKTKTISLREKMPACAICSPKPRITELQDYEKFCGSGPHDKIRSLDLLPAEQRISASEYAKQYRHNSVKASGTILLDVRPANEFAICHLPEAENFPLEDLKSMNIEDVVVQLNAKNKKSKEEEQQQQLAKGKKVTTNNGVVTNGERVNVFICCHRGNDSQLATQLLRERLQAIGLLNRRFTVRDIVGGLESWALEVDETFARY